MSRTRCTFVMTALLAGAAFVAGCSDEDKRALPTPGITTVGGGTSPAGIVTPFPTPQVTNNQVDSSASKGYTATFPEGWNFYPNRIQTRDASVDVVFEPLVAGATSQASIAIECQVTDNPQPETHIAFEATKVARIGVNSDIRASQRQISGLTATVLDYRFESQNEESVPPLDKQDVIFSGGKCDWKITTTAAAGERPKHDAQFNAFLDSFQLK